MSWRRSRRPSVLLRTGALLVVAALAAGCTESPPPPEPGRRVVAARGAMSTTAPDAFELSVTYLDSAPVGEGMILSHGGEPRLVVYASATALAEHLGDDPAKREIYTFGHLVTVLPAALPVMLLHDDCDFVEVRPFTDGTFYGATRTYACADGRAVVRVVAVSASRDVSVVAEALADESSAAQRVATTAVADLEVDVGELPTTVVSPPVILTE